jgi:DNA ligase-1
MKAFSRLLDRLTYTPARNAKLMLMRNYFRATPDPDRGFALAALTDGLPIDFPLRRVLAEIGENRFDPDLFRMSRDDVGDTAETVALIWPATEVPGDAPSLSEIVVALGRAGRSGHAALLTQWLDRLDATGRWALLKFLSGAPRVGVSGRLAKQAVADAFDRSVDDIEELWHGVAPPYAALFDWLEHRAERPSLASTPIFRPLMLAHALEESDWQAMRLDEVAAEWKWDGIRIQAVSERGERRLYTRTGDDISHSFPDVLAHMSFEGAIDGELLVIRDGALASFGDLQQRLNRKAVDAKTIAAYPAAIRAYDLLLDGEEDLRALTFAERRKRLEAFVAAAASPRIDLSPMQSFETWEGLAALRAEPPEGDAQLSEGLMLKRWDSPYEAGRPKGPWFKWKRDPRLIDAVLMYAQRGHGKRSSFYSDYTFGVWREDDAGMRSLTPVGKAYFGFTDEELKQLDKFVRDNTVERFGPVRSVRAGLDFGLVLEVAFEGLQRSTRHKSGVAMRFPRISRIRWDKPAREADELETLERMLD